MTQCVYNGPTILQPKVCDISKCKKMQCKQESVQSKFITLKHVNDKINIADVFTKEDCDTKHFVSIRNILVQQAPCNKGLSTSM